jgi:PrtD family type I secretion system ABC transporter
MARASVVNVTTQTQANSPTVWGMLSDERSAFGSTLGYSLAINLLGLTSSLYMLQIYDRVLTSYSFATLIVLSLIAAFAFLAMGGLEALRSSLLQRTGARIAHRLGPHAFHVQLRGSAALNAPALQPLRDVDTIRGLVGGPAATAAFDLPWSPIYFVLLYILHPVLFWMTVAAGALLALIAYWNDRVNAAASAEAAKGQLKSLQFAESAASAGEPLVAMGAGASMSDYWLARSRDAMEKGLYATEREAAFHSLAKFLRNCLQTGLLGAGAALTISGDLSSGGLIAGTILGTRAIAPVEAAIGAWKTVLGAREAWTRLDAALAALFTAAPGMTLPRPSGAIAADNVTLVLPGASRPILTRLSFQLNAGEQLALVGPSGSGKSTLTRAIMGLMGCAGGDIRIDGAEVTAWQRADLGRWIGYLPQAPVPLAGTIAQNIARFADAPSEQIIAAAQQAGVHELILSLPNGYDTDLSGAGVRLSGGQMQRIALAGALFGDRPLIILDEPEAHLDTDGETQLRQTLQRLRARRATVIIVSHRPSAVQMADKLLLLRDSHAEFGPREEILNKIMRATTLASAGSAKARVAGE